MPFVPTILGSLFVDDQGSADRPAALLWPSLFTDHRMWRHQIPALRQMGWRTLAIDPPAHGQSVGPDRCFTMDACADAAIAVLDAAGIRSPALLLGTSWGGFVAPRIALRAPDRVSGLVLFNTSAERPMPSQRAKATLLATLMRVPALDGFVDRINLSTLFSTETQRQHPQIGADLVAQYRSWDRRTLVTAIRSVLLERDSILGDLPAITVPAIVATGEKDTILPAKLGLAIADAIPHARFNEVSRAAHLIPLEAPEAAKAIIREMVDRIR